MLAEADAAHVKVARAYVPYEASFGGFDSPVNPDSASYAKSVQGGVDQLQQMVTRVAGECPQTRFAVAGYSQGAHVVSMWAQRIGAGSGEIRPERVAAIALFGDPVRAPGAPVFPGRAGQQVPDPAPGTDGVAVRDLDQVPPAPTSGGGIGPDRDQTGDFGVFAGRVLSVCASGDLACDAPDHAPILKAVANIAGQAEFGGDPLRALWSVTQALAFTSIKTVSSAINEDVQGNSLQDLSIAPKVSLSQRIADASDPRTPLDPGDVVQAAMKIATIGFNSVVAVARTVLSPDTITAVATAGLTDPIAGLATFGIKLLGALPQLMPPQTAIGLVQSAFQVVTSNITDNRDLVDTAVWAKYSDAITRHDSYGVDPITSGGRSATQFTADWFTAVARDLSASNPADDKSIQPQPTMGSNFRGSATATTPTGASSPGSPRYPWDSGSSGLEDVSIPGPTVSVPAPSASSVAPPHADAH